MKENLQLKTIIDAVKFARKSNIKEIIFSNEFSKSLIFTEEECKELDKVCKDYCATFYIKDEYPYSFLQAIIFME